MQFKKVEKKKTIGKKTSKIYQRIYNYTFVKYILNKDKKKEVKC